MLPKAVRDCPKAGALAAPKAGALVAPNAGAEAPNVVVAPPKGDAPKAAEGRRQAWLSER